MAAAAELGWGGDASTRGGIPERAPPPGAAAGLPECRGRTRGFPRWATPEARADGGFGRRESGADSDSLESLGVLFSRSWGGRAWLSVVLAQLGALEPWRIPGS